MDEVNASLLPLLIPPTPLRLYWLYEGQPVELWLGDNPPVELDELPRIACSCLISMAQWNLTAFGWRPIRLPRI